MTAPDALAQSTSSLAPSTAVPSETDLVLPPKPEQRLSFGIPVLESAKFRLSHDVRVPVAPSRVRLALSFCA